MAPTAITPEPSIDQTNEIKSDDSLQRAREVITATVSDVETELSAVNTCIHSNPELGYEEVIAHSSIAGFLESQGFTVQRHAYNLETSFVAEVGSGGRLVIFCAEYDALPEIGHGCGHNLIAMASVSGFVAAARALLSLGIAGRVRILGTPAEEGGGGKVKLIEAGAFSEDVSAAIMCHALPVNQVEGDWTGIAGFRSTASRRFSVEFFGKTSHAGQEPWNGVNALDAAVATYASVSMMRQQIKPYERVQGVIQDGGKVANIIPDYTRMNWGVRSLTIEQVDVLYERVKHCAQGAAEATGCTVKITAAVPYKELRVNETLCKAYMSEMAVLRESIQYMEKRPSAAGTDMGNVSYTVPSLHGMFGIPTPESTAMHSKNFADSAGTVEAYKAALKAGKGLAMVAIRVLYDANTAARVREDFETETNRAA